MPHPVNVIIHAIADDGLPDMDGLSGRVAFLFDGCIVSGWPLDETDDDGQPLWEADGDVGRHGPFGGVTHWVEFPVSVWRMASIGA